jgi:hypothetical protein
MLNNTATSFDLEYIDQLVLSILSSSFILDAIKEHGYSSYQDYIDDRRKLDSLSPDRRKIVNVTILGVINGVISYLLNYFMNKK